MSFGVQASNGNMANSSKKRKASEPPRVSSKKRAKSKRRATAARDEMPFTTECPLAVGKVSGRDDACIGTETLADGFTFDYAIRPGPQWQAMRSYRNVKYSDNTFTIGSIVYINKTNPPPPPPSSDATSAEILQYDRQNFWVAKIADTRAESDREVFIRVFWLYWPEELPMGRQPYHSSQELVLSNAMDIVDAQTISCAADVMFWDENDIQANIGDRFWRQTFDTGKLGADRKGGLSVLRKHCKCLRAYNPDRIMIDCKNEQCQTWNHEECLLDDLSERAWTYYEDGTLDGLDVSKIGIKQEEDGHARSFFSNLGKFVHDKMQPAVNTVVEQSIAHQEDGTPMTPVTLSDSISPGKRGRSRKSQSAPPRAELSNPWQDKLRVSVVEADDKNDEGPVLARIEEIISQGSASTSKRAIKHEKEHQGSVGRTWTIRVHCLVCKTAL